MTFIFIEEVISDLVFLTDTRFCLSKTISFVMKNLCGRCGPCFGVVQVGSASPPDDVVIWLGWIGVGRAGCVIMLSGCW